MLLFDHRMSCQKTHSETVMYVTVLFYAYRLYSVTNLIIGKHREVHFFHR